MTATIHVGDCLATLRKMPDASVHCIVTSPPYWGLRDYGHDGQIGLEDSPIAYLANLVAVFREARRVLKDNGVAWVNIGDSYSGKKIKGTGIKRKDLVGIPWRFAFAMQDDGWWLRSDCIWHKPSPMPESVPDRPTKGHEYVFMFTKSTSYNWNADAVREPISKGNDGKGMHVPLHGSHVAKEGHRRQAHRQYAEIKGANRRTVWTIPTQPFKGAHFATMPLALAERCVASGCPAGGVVLDPFCGAGTTGVAAVRGGKEFVGLELNPAYAEIALRRISDESPLSVRAVSK